MANVSRSALPCSRSALDRLGRRLAELGEPSAEDKALLMKVLEAYDDVLADAEERVRAIVDGFTASGGPRLGIATRVKTTGTIREKLRRQTGMGLKGMQDIAGVRIAGDLTRRQQNELGIALLTAFSRSERPPRLSDRRVDPSFGYRALHAIVFVNDVPIEIQIRTSEQDAWAQLVEKLGDLWGRGLRYGEAPADSARTALGGITRARLMAILMQISESLETVSVDELQDEELSDQLLDLEKSLRSSGDELDSHLDREDMLQNINAIKEDIAERRAGRSVRQDEFRELLTTLTSAAEGWD